MISNQVDLGTYFIQQIMDDAVFKKDQQQWVNHLVLKQKRFNQLKHQR